MIMSQDIGNQIKISEIKSTSKIVKKFDLRSDKNILKSDRVTTRSLKSFINEKDGQNMHIQKEHTPKVSGNYKINKSQSISFFSSSSAINTQRIRRHISHKEYLQDFPALHQALEILRTYTVMMNLILTLRMILI